MADSHSIQHAGVFTITTGAAVAQTLHGVLTVPQNSSSVSGHGTLTQATNPPLNVHNAFSGVVHALGLGKAQQIYSLSGSAIPPLLGAPHVTQLLIVLDGIWGTAGKATYTYVTGSSFHEVTDVPVHVQWLPQL